ncbi:integral membrane protein MviN [Acidimicrobium ferrooxidans DSM 10331]|uniref:Integral membrane protein MviN n=1 Tax=Acidimicrobium ferrooxidans (strain DSM 10331 / JCM 15462 / NBRC 103882 / ICP) TaxID=525909 RepID=C7M1F3_ACIFD|nr:murein biosynthesis integral membrane protein MurJ [Acidimicrobium ferrooxidans]ACU53002.1 integral membrane protein MviN [Acidimicrobium ferrooxidans DSM 10331]
MVQARLVRLLAGRGRSVGENATAMAIGTAASRLSGFVRLIVLAVVLGVRPLADAFNLANNTPNMLYDLLLGGVISSTILPVVAARIARAGERAGERSLAAIMTIGVVGLLVATVLFEVLAPAVVDLYLIGDHLAAAGTERAVAIELLRLFAPQLFFYGTISLATAALNLRGNFAAPAFAPIANNVVAIAVLVAFRVADGSATLDEVASRPDAVLLLGLGTTLGVAAQLGVLMPVMARLGLGLRPRLRVSDPAVREVVSLSGWTAGYVVANQVALFVVLALAATRAGYVSAYNYAYLFFQLPYAVVSLSVMSALQPRLARSWAAGDRARFRRDLAKALAVGVGATIPLAVLAWVGGPAGLDLLVGYGAVNEHGVALIAGALRGMAVGLPGFSLFLMLIQALQAMRNARAAFVAYLVENGLNIVLAVVALGPLGVEGLGLALGLAYTIGAIVAIVIVRSLRGLGPIAPLLGSWVQLAVASVVGGAVLAALLPSTLVAPNLGFALRVLGGLVAGVVVFGAAVIGLRTIRVAVARGVGR